MLVISISLIAYQLTVANNIHSESTPTLRHLQATEKVVEAVVEPIQYKRTATGGVVNSSLTLLTLVAFIGNFAFTVIIFWISK
jgi:hypothetical protein